VSVLCLGSAHGSPGVTTAATALAGVWPEGRRLLMVEADASGGMLAARLGLSDSPGLVSLAAAARRGWDGELVWRHAQTSGDVSVLVAPASADHVRGAVRDVAGPLAGWCGRQADVDVIVDCGRLASDPVAAPLIEAADVVCVLTRPTVDQLRPAAARLETLAAAGVEGGLLLVGDSPYGPAEVRESMGVEVAGVVAWDPVAAEVMAGGSGQDVRRSLLVRSVATLVAGFTTDLMDAPGEAESQRLVGGVG
jgi:MinD-like ATPase involved in chromosome partitioning or flagellar assembly